MYHPKGEQGSPRRAPTNRKQAEEKNRADGLAGAIMFGPDAVLASPALPLPEHLSFKQKPLEDDYIVDWGTELGVGASGLVRKATHIASGKLFAVKFLADNRASRQEIACWATCLPHPHILPIVDVFECEMAIQGEYLERAWLAVVSPLMEGGELYFEVVKRKRLPENEVKLVAYQLLHAVAHMHLKGVCHRDIKMENILLQCGDSLHARLADFGFATGLLGVSSKFTLLYVAPEILRSFQFGKVTGQRLPYGALCDEWSIGVCVYMMLCGAPPFPSATTSLTGEFQMRVLRGRLEFAEREWAGVSTTAKAFVSALLTVDPTLRATCARALAHPWLAGVTLQGVCRGDRDASFFPLAPGAGAGAGGTGAGAGGTGAGAGGTGAGAGGSGAAPAPARAAAAAMALSMEDNNLFRRRTQRRTVAAANSNATPTPLAHPADAGDRTPLAVPLAALHVPSPMSLFHDRSRSVSRALSPQPCGMPAYRHADASTMMSCSAPAILDDSGLADIDMHVGRGISAAAELSDESDLEEADDDDDDGQHGDVDGVDVQGMDEGDDRGISCGDRV